MQRVDCARDTGGSSDTRRLVRTLRFCGLVLLGVTLGQGLARAEGYAPLYAIDAATGFRFKIAISLNGVKVVTAEPPRNLNAMATVNERLKDGTNTLTVDYEVLSVEPGSEIYGPKSFTVQVKRQADWNDPRTASVVASVEGPTEPFLPVGTRASKTATFTVSLPGQPASTQVSGEAVTAADRAAVFGIIRKLHTAYATKDLDGVLSLTQGRIETLAKTYGRTVEQTQESERQYLQTLFANPQWSMNPVNLDGAQVALEGNQMVVSRSAPIVSSPKIPIQGGFLLVEHARFVFQRRGAGWKLVGD